VEDLLDLPDPVDSHRMLGEVLLVPPVPGDIPHRPGAVVLLLHHPHMVAVRLHRAGSLRTGASGELARNRLAEDLA